MSNPVAPLGVCASPLVGVVVSALVTTHFQTTVIATASPPAERRLVVRAVSALGGDHNQDYVTVTLHMLCRLLLNVLGQVRHVSAGCC